MSTNASSYLSSPPLIVSVFSMMTPVHEEPAAGYEILRIDEGGEGNVTGQYWTAKIKGRGREFARHFHDKDYGDKQASWLMAKAYGDAVLRLLPIGMLREGQIKLRASDASFFHGQSASLQLQIVNHTVGRECGFSDDFSEAAAVVSRDEMVANRRLEFLDTWFDELMPLHSFIRIHAYVCTQQGSPCITVAIGKEGESCEIKHRNWSLLRQTYEECLAGVWDHIQNCLIELHGMECWKQFRRRYRRTFFSSSAKTGFKVGYRYFPAEIYKQYPPSPEIAHLLEGINMPASNSSAATT
ncbi:hypothetical protein [Comamonas humi]